jgi:hypothetical protein
MTFLSVALAAALAIDLTPKPAAPIAPAGHAKQPTRCAACHTAEGWDRVTFDHARTGFPLEGAHAGAPCRGCHRESDFKAAVPRACVACHRDVHAGRLGTRCANCHGAVAWNEQSFGAEAHRRSNFPLDGRHAVLPCEECHGDVRDRSFARPTKRCVDCHGPERDGAAFPHASAGNSDDCRRCHGTWRFLGGYLPGHDACFPIRSGTHSGIRCLRCHTSYPPISGTCNYSDPTLACLNCHSNCPHDGACPITSQQCADCHRSGVGGGG